MVLAFEILRYLGAEKAPRDGMVRIATQSGGATGILNVYEK
jgi:hypothetical protein